MISNPVECFNKKKVVNFDIIHHERRGDLMQKSYKEHKTVKELDFFEYPDTGKTKVVSSVTRNIKRDDLWIQRNLMIEHFKKNF